MSHDDPHATTAPARLTASPGCSTPPGEYEFQGITIRAVMTPAGRGHAAQQAQRGIRYRAGRHQRVPPGEHHPAAHRAADRPSSARPTWCWRRPGGGSDYNLLSYRAINQTAQQLDARWLIPMHYRAEREPSAVEPEGAGGVPARVGRGRGQFAGPGPNAGYAQQPAAVIAGGADGSAVSARGKGILVAQAFLPVRSRRRQECLRYRGSRATLNGYTRSPRCRPP